MTDKKDNNAERPAQPDKPKPRQDHLKFLKECIAKGPDGIAEWNDYRKKNPKEQIWLQDADLDGAHLNGADLDEAHLEGSCLFRAHLNDAELFRAHLEGALLTNAHLEGADLLNAHLEGAVLGGYLEGADLIDAHLEGAKLLCANLEGADLRNSQLEGTDFSFCYLQDTQFAKAVVDGATCFWMCDVNRWKPRVGRGSHQILRGTDFTGVALENARIDPPTKLLLESNIRRHYWHYWLTGQNFLVRWLARWFWDLTDYGLSTKQIIKMFFRYAFIFAVIYYIWGLGDSRIWANRDHPGIIANLFVDSYGPIHCSQVPLRTLYFSVVTMTTLGFGDIHANAHSYWFGGLAGYALLSIQVILGYILLGALITRFAILFTTGAPAGRTYFMEMDEQTQKRLDEIRQKKIAKQQMRIAKRVKRRAEQKEK